ncbi:hypothetical protein OIDMADRAFT_62526 [Oidiodendron maius Zn]|uniref:Uncharacterized protein n=1 Tax=Oidiodendron maius (strain Zn) TaxID=913774 RepID=A0A0C3C0Z9_OIDMZ|nr:hypothetical protein OIDMADRAFT_62526 [Oidiodendron maius Zn]
MHWSLYARSVFAWSSLLLSRSHRRLCDTTWSLYSPLSSSSSSWSWIAAYLQARRNSGRRPVASSHLTTVPAQAGSAVAAVKSLGVLGNRGLYGLAFPL